MHFFVTRRSFYHITTKLHRIGCYVHFRYALSICVFYRGYGSLHVAWVLRFTSVWFESVTFAVYSCPTNQVVHQKRLSTTEYLSDLNEVTSKQDNYTFFLWMWNCKFSRLDIRFQVLRGDCVEELSCLHWSLDENYPIRTRPVRSHQEPTFY